MFQVPHLKNKLDFTWNGRSVLPLESKMLTMWLPSMLVRLIGFNTVGHITHRDGDKKTPYGVCKQTEAHWEPLHWGPKCDHIHKYISEALQLCWDVGYIYEAKGYFYFPSQSFIHIWVSSFAVSCPEVQKEKFYLKASKPLISFYSTSEHQTSQESFKDRWKVELFKICFKEIFLSCFVDFVSNIHTKVTDGPCRCTKVAKLNGPTSAMSIWHRPLKNSSYKIFLIYLLLAVCKKNNFPLNLKTKFQIINSLKIRISVQTG